MISSKFTIPIRQSRPQRQIFRHRNSAKRHYCLLRTRTLRRPMNRMKPRAKPTMSMRQPVLISLLMALTGFLRKSISQRQRDTLRILTLNTRIRSRHINQRITPVLKMPRFSNTVRRVTTLRAYRISQILNQTMEKDMNRFRLDRIPRHRPNARYSH